MITGPSFGSTHHLNEQHSRCATLPPCYPYSMPLSSIIALVESLVVASAGFFLLVENYLYWRKYGANDLWLWILGGAFAVLLAVWLLVTRFLVPATGDPHVLALLARSREFLTVFVFLFFLFIGFREYVWRK